MSAADLLARLDRVHQCAPQCWRALCPAHPSRHRTQSLSIRELSDGTLLVRCHAGCDIGQIVAAAGMELRDLFPRGHAAPAAPRHPQRARHWHAIRECVQTLYHECLVCALAAEDIAAGQPITAEDAARVAECASRIRAAIEACT
jgi:hypothetical protein